MDKPQVQPASLAKRDAVLNRIRSKYPDKQYADDEAYFGQIEDDYNEYDKKVGELSAANEDYRKRESELSDMFAKDPRSADYLMRWKNGEDPAIALVREFGDDVVEIISDPKRQEEVAKAKQEYADRVANDKKLQEEYQVNLKQSLAMIDDLVAGGESEDEVDKVMKAYITIGTDVLMGKFNRETYDMIKKSFNYDSAVANAAEEGVIKGRNEKIEEKLAKNKKGDGHSPLGGETGMQADRTPRRPLGALDNFGDGNQTIWERGGEKRRKY